MIQLLKRLSYGKSLRALYISLEILRKMSGLFSLEKKRLRGVNNISVYKYFMRENDDEGSRLFLVVPSDRTRGNGHELKSTKFHLNRRRKPFTQWRWSNTTKRLPREEVEGTSVELLKTQPDIQSTTVCSSWLYTGVGVEDLKIPSNLKDSVISLESWVGTQLLGGRKNYCWKIWKSIYWRCGENGEGKEKKYRPPQNKEDGNIN